MNASRLPSLDGWRGISIIMVLLSHCTYAAGFKSTPAWFSASWQWIANGDLGVRFFFVISGFLITWLMVAEVDRTGRVNFIHFYERRALRILPVYFAFMLTLWLLGHCTPFRQTRELWMHNLTFTTNLLNGSFLEQTWTTAHLWSLAVEEQFYLIWPAVFLLAGVAANWRRGLLILFIPVLIGPVSRIVSAHGWYPTVLARLFTHFSFLNYCDCLAVGCAAAILFSRRQEWIRNYFGSRYQLIAVSGLSLILIPLFLSKLKWLTFLTASVGVSLQSFGFATLLIQGVLFPERGLYRAINWRWLAFIGVLSYSIYIWQMIFCSPPAKFGLGPVWWMSFPGWMVPAFAVALVSYYGLERPLLKWRSRLRAS